MELTATAPRRGTAIPNRPSQPEQPYTRAVAKPAILAVDDDAPVLRAIERDLRTKYAADYRVLAAQSGQEALEAVRGLTLRGDVIALFVVDQRMPVMTGTEFLTEAILLQPDAKRVLLTAYADTDVAIRAINEIRLDQYLLKPWDPPDERLYPVLDDLLSDWAAGFRPEFEGLRLLAGRWTPGGHVVRDFLTRNQVPYSWLDPVADDAGRRLAASLEGGADADRVTIVLPDGRTLRDPATRELAEAIGLQTHAALPFYDLVIAGAGPAGLAAAVYGSSEGLKTLIIEREAPGGQAGTTSRIENYLGFPAGLSGGDLARRALAQARRLGAEILSSQSVAGIRRADPYRTIMLEDGSELSCQTAVVATGVAYRQLDVPGATELSGAGVYYGAATTEALLYRDTEVGIIGGGNSAGQAAVHLARFATRVHVFVRGPDLTATMSRYLIDQLDALPNVTLHARSTTLGVSGAGHLQRGRFGTPDGEIELELAALFVFIGQRPHTEWLEGVIQRDDAGFVVTGPDLLADGRPPAGWGIDRKPFLLEGSVPGIFAAGDVRHRSIKRIASAVGEGAMAVQFVHQYLAGL
jgi:thioredoxin reductase (NADPH)